MALRIYDDHSSLSATPSGTATAQGWTLVATGAAICWPVAWILKSIAIGYVGTGLAAAAAAVIWMRGIPVQVTETTFVEASNGWTLVWSAVRPKQLAWALLLGAVGAVANLPAALFLCEVLAPGLLGVHGPTLAAALFATLVVPAMGLVLLAGAIGLRRVALAVDRQRRWLRPFRSDPVAISDVVDVHTTRDGLRIETIDGPLHVALPGASSLDIERARRRLVHLCRALGGMEARAGHHRQQMLQALTAARPTDG
ncbi:MAG: hypothetical protein KTR31_01975 [Myxococcales bacterium]|nr:hypothetical protein [Myxococcales bacterium]